MACATTSQYFRDIYNVDRVEALKGPNAMVFGRGGVGGVINRVTRQAGWDARRGKSRSKSGRSTTAAMTADLGTDFNEKRRRSSDRRLREFGLLSRRRGYRALRVQPDVRVRAGRRTRRFGPATNTSTTIASADRGISSFNGRPVETDPSTFFGDPTRSNADVTVNVFSSVLSSTDSGTGSAAQPHAATATTTSSTRTSSRERSNAAGTTVSDHCVQQRDRSDKTSSTRPMSIVLEAHGTVRAHGARRRRSSDGRRLRTSGTRDTSRPSVSNTTSVSGAAVCPDDFAAG